MHPIQPAIAAALILTSRHTCTCGAYTSEPSGYCDKCRARQAWRRHHRAPAPRRRRTSRRLARRTGRFRARLLVFVTGSRRIAATPVSALAVLRGDH